MQTLSWYPGWVTTQRVQPSVGVLLAGGSGSRFAGTRHKLVTSFRGRPMIEWGLDAVRGAGLVPWVVWGALADHAPRLDDDVVVLRNDDWRDGMATSLAVAVDRADALGLDAIVVGPADQPLVPAAAWAAVAGADPGLPIVVATYDGRRANPVRLARSVWPLLPRTGDRGARVLLEVRHDLVTEVACPGNPIDIDTLEDLDQWNS